jgi:hypothetical protein
MNDLITNVIHDSNDRKDASGDEDDRNDNGGAGCGGTNAADDGNVKTLTYILCLLFSSTTSLMRDHHVLVLTLILPSAIALLVLVLVDR